MPVNRFRPLLVVTDERAKWGNVMKRAAKGVLVVAMMGLSAWSCGDSGAANDNAPANKAPAATAAATTAASGGSTTTAAGYVGAGY